MSYTTDPDRCREHCKCGARCAEKKGEHVHICAVHRYLKGQGK